MPDLAGSAEWIRAKLKAAGIASALAESELPGPGVLIVAPALTAKLGKDRNGRRCWGSTWTLFVVVGDTGPGASLGPLGKLMGQVAEVFPPAGEATPVEIDSPDGGRRPAYRFPFQLNIT